MKPALKILAFVLFLVPAFAKAQSEKDKVEALRVSFITKKLELTVAESEKFWPIYNDYTDKVKALRRNLRQNYKRHSEQVSERDAEDLYQLELQSRQQELDLFKQYSERLKAVIGIKKLVKLHVAEEEFKRTVLEAIKGKSE